MKQRAALLAVLAFAALSCNLLPTSADDLAATAESAISDLELPEELGEPEAPPPEPATSLDSAGGPESLNLDDPATYAEPVEQISSYRFTMRYAFEADSGVRGSVTGTGERTVVPSATRVRFEAFDDAVQPAELPFEFSIIENVVSATSPEFDTGCLTFPSGTLMASPLSILIDLEGFLTGEAPRMRPDEEVNGVATYRFALDSSNVVQDALDVAEVTDGTIYLARDGGYVVRLELNGTGPSEMLSGDADLVGRLAYSLDYYDFNQPLQIVPPAGCEQITPEAVPEYPVTADAYQLSSTFGIVSYKSDLPLEEVAQFYRDEMAAAGWTLTDEFSGGPAVLMTFSGEAGTVQVTLGFDEASGSVDVGIIGGG